MRRLLTGSVLAGMLGIAAFVAVVAGAQQGGPAELRPVHVEGKTIAPGVKMTVHVFYGKNGPKGRPTPSGNACVDDDSQNGYALFGTAKPGGLAFLLDDTYAPVAGFSAPVGRSFAAWNGAIGSSYFSGTTDRSAPDSPSQDGTNVIGWARLVPKNVLAATWTYTDDAGRVLEADVFYNVSQQWAVLNACNESSRFDIENIGTHELGHVLAMDHVSDSGKQATMYPSAPAGEVRKRTLTAGDVQGARASLNPN